MKSGTKVDTKAKLDNMDIKIQSLYFTAEQNMILKNMFSKHNFMVSKKSFNFNKPDYEALVYNLSLNLTLFENVLDLKSNYQDISIILINKDNPSGLNKFKKILNEEENFAKKVILFGTSSEDDAKYASYIQIPFEESNLLNTIYNAYLLYYKINFKNYENNLLFYESDTKFINIFKKQEVLSHMSNLNNKSDLKKVSLAGFNNFNNFNSTNQTHSENALNPITNLTNLVDIDINTIDKKESKLNPHIENFLSEKDLNKNHLNNNLNINTHIETTSKAPLNSMSFKTSLDDLNIAHLPVDEFKLDLSTLSKNNINNNIDNINTIKTVDTNKELNIEVSLPSLDSIHHKENQAPVDLDEFSNVNEDNKDNKDSFDTTHNNSTNNSNTNLPSILDFDFNQLNALKSNLNAFNLNTLNDPVKETEKEKVLKGGMGMSSLDVNINQKSLDGLNKINEALAKPSFSNLSDEVQKSNSEFNFDANAFDSIHDETENSINNFNSHSDEIDNFSHVEKSVEKNDNVNVEEEGLNFDIPLLPIHELNEENSINSVNTQKIKPLDFSEEYHLPLDSLGLEKEYYDRDDVRVEQGLSQDVLEEIHEKAIENNELYEELVQSELNNNQADINNNINNNTSEEIKLEEFNDLMLERQKLSNFSEQPPINQLSQKDIDYLDEELKNYNINKLTILNQLAQVRQLCETYPQSKTGNNETCGEIIFDDPYEEEKHIFFINFETFELYTNFELKLTNSLTNKSLNYYTETALCHQVLTQELKINTLKNKMYYLNNLAVSNQTFDQLAWAEAKENFDKQGFYKNNLITFIMMLTYNLDPNPRLFQEIDIYKRYNLNLTPLLKNLYSKDITILKWAIGMYQKNFMLSALSSEDDLDLSLNEKEFVQFINTSYILGFLEEKNVKDKSSKGLFGKIKKIF